MLQNVFLPLFFPGWPLSNVAEICNVSVTS